MNKFTQSLLKFQALTLRERLMAVAAVIAVLVFLIDVAFLGPQRQRNKALQQQIAQQRIEVGALSKAIAALAGGEPVNALVKERAERDGLRATVAQAESFVGQSATGVPFGELISAMIRATPGLALVSLRTLPAEVFYQSPAAAQPKPGAPKQADQTPPMTTLYKHGLDVAVKGKYPDLLSYLRSVPGKSNRMFWSSVKLDVAVYPEATLRMTIYILSDRAESPLG